MSFSFLQAKNSKLQCQLCQSSFLRLTTGCRTLYYGDHLTFYSEEAERKVLAQFDPEPEE